MIRQFGLSILVFFINNSTSAQEVQVIGGQWQFKSAQDSVWLHCTIPGNSYSALLENEKIPEPFLGENENLVQWVSEQDWWFKTEFIIHENILSKSNIDLSAEGLDMDCEIFINDHFIAHTNNSFLKYDIPVPKQFLKAKNELLVKIKSPKLLSDQLYEAASYKLPGGPRVMMRKPQFHFGWDFGPVILSSGINRPVKLIAYDSLKLMETSIQTVQISKEGARLVLKYEIQNNEGNSTPFSAELKLGDTTIYFNEKVLPGINNLEYNFFITSPKLWWPNELGDAHLYDCQLKLKLDSVIIAEKNWKTGIRTIQLIQEKDEMGRSFYFKVNDKAIFCKGANYIPPDIISYPSNRIDQIIKDAVASHFNMIRVWGGGQYEQDYFYELCDKHGIIVWQDFMFACAMYPGDSVFLNNIKEEANYQLKRLSKYACIGLWCGNNEINEAWHHWGWRDQFNKPAQEELWDDYQKLFQDILPNEVKAICPHTSYHESSPLFGRGNSKFNTHGDAHDWGLWHDGMSFEQLKNRIPRFMSEFGFQSIPDQSSLKKFIPADEMFLSSGTMLNHQKHPRGNQIIQQYLNAGYPKHKNIEELIYLNQLCQGEGISELIKTQRKSRPYCMGSLYWQFNDCWPGISWSGIDYYNRWKALQHKVKDAFEPVSVHLEYEQGFVKVYAINDKLEHQNIEFEIGIQDFFGNPIYFDSEKLELKPNSSALVLVPAINIDELNLTNNHYAFVKWNSESGSGSSNLLFEKLKKIKLPKPSIQFMDEVQTDEGFLFRINSTTYAKSVYLKEDSGYSFYPNYFDLNPGEQKLVFCKTKLHWQSIKMDYRCINDFLNDE